MVWALAGDSTITKFFDIYIMIAHVSRNNYVVSEKKADYFFFALRKVKVLQ